MWIRVLVLCWGIAVLASAGVIDQDRKLLANDGAAGDFFGDSVGIGDGLIAVGATNDYHNGVPTGSVYVLNAETGAQLTKLLAADGAPFDFFGRSLAIAGGVVAVGASGDDDNGDDSGSAYILDIATGLQLAKLLPDDGTAGDRFGRSIAIADGLVVVGAIGSAYVFDSSGSQVVKLLPNDAPSGGGGFGSSVAIADGVIGVGAEGDNDNGLNSGAAYLYDATTHVQLQKLIAADGEPSDFFGRSIAMSNGFVGVGAPGDDDNGFSAGSVYAFHVSTGTQIAKLLPNGPSGLLGSEGALSISNDLVVVGGREGNGAFLFELPSGRQVARLMPGNDTENYFGDAVSIVGDTVAVGAIFDDENGNNSGAAYFFTIQDVCPGDVTADCQVGLADLAVVLANFGVTPSGRQEGDLDGDSDVDLADLAILLTNFGRVCL